MRHCKKAQPGGGVTRLSGEAAALLRDALYSMDRSGTLHPKQTRGVYFLISTAAPSCPTGVVRAVKYFRNWSLPYHYRVKPSDSRSRSYVAQHGNRCWEADILPAAVIEQAIDAEIESRLDATLWDQRDREIERSRTLL